MEGPGPAGVWGEGQGVTGVGRPPKLAGLCPGDSDRAHVRSGCCGTVAAVALL